MDRCLSHYKDGLVCIGAGSSLNTSFIESSLALCLSAGLVLLIIEAECTENQPRIHHRERKTHSVVVHQISLCFL